MPNYSGKFFCLFGWWALLLLADSCRKKEPLSLKTMSKVLLKMHLAESYVRSIPRTPKPNDSLAAAVPFMHDDSLLKYNAQILKEFKITKADFTASLDYYKQKPLLLDSIYQIVLSDIAVMQAKHTVD